MHRSSSATRVSSSSEFLNHSSSSSSLSSSSQSQTFKPLSISSDQQLPTYNPQSQVAKKERTRLRSAETAVHLIPLFLILCAIVLWFFSNPAVDLTNKGDSIIARIEGLTVNGDIDIVGPRSNSVSDLKPGNFKSAKPLAEADPQD
ncbi:unnamed protein product [Camellia sinensis]